MPLEVAVLEGKDDDRLERLVLQSPHGSLFACPSWAHYLSFPYESIGVFKGRELVGGGVIPLSGPHVSRYVPYTPWIGIVGRSESESENLEIAGAVARHLIARHGEVTLTLPPEWTDLRAFTWEGMRAHVRYTYRGHGRAQYEKRLGFKNCFIHREVDYRPHADIWQVQTLRTGDSEVTLLRDWKTAYYWKANKGGSFHAECVNTMIAEAEEDGLGFDMVGCNSPDRGLFKRAFGGRLTPYYAVTNSDVLDLRKSDARGHLQQVSAGS